MISCDLISLFADVAQRWQDQRQHLLLCTYIPLDFIEVFLYLLLSIAGGQSPKVGTLGRQNEKY